MLRIAGAKCSQRHGVLSLISLSTTATHHWRRAPQRSPFIRRYEYTDATPAPVKTSWPSQIFPPVPKVDTIYALSTGTGRAGIAIVRISGPACSEIYESICPSRSWSAVSSRRAYTRTLHDPSDNTVILDSSALVIHFAGPKSVTGEDILELHIHGGPATIKAVLSAIPKCLSESTIRMAEPGEFTRRAFENDKLDLAQVEALSDTLSAETEQQRRAAVRGSSAQLGRIYEEWREGLLEARGELEAMIDFSEDHHFDEDDGGILGSSLRKVDDMISTISRHEHASHRGDLLRRGIEIALIGPPNTGKSSLLNLIVGREASIVSSEAGTTRDIVEVRYDIGGYLCTFADTAGLRTSSKEAGSKSEVGEVEKEGIKRAKARANDSDLIIVLASIEPETNGTDQSWAIQYDTSSLSNIAKNRDGLAKPTLIVLNKSDTISVRSLTALVESFKLDLKGIWETEGMPPVIPISCLEAETPAIATTSSQLDDAGNINMFTTQLKSLIESMTSSTPDDSMLLAVTERQRQLLTKCKTHLINFCTEFGRTKHEDTEVDIVIAAEHLRSAGGCLARITGRGMAGDVEEVLGVVFEKFCVGK